MTRKILLILCVYFLALFQVSFLIHFPVWGMTPNLIYLFIILLNFFEKPKRNDGFYVSFFAGLFLDIFSGGIIGLNVLILSLIALILKMLTNKYVQIPFKNI